MFWIFTFLHTFDKETTINMARVQQHQPLTLEEYMSLDSAGKKKNLFIRVLDRLKVTEETLQKAQAKILEANQALETANAKAFAGNEELRELKMQKEIVNGLHRDCVKIINKHRVELASIKSKWWFKLFGNAKS